ncbi:unnamed protein product [Symbiodinium natans]|uniref:Uncharacterized protein n=1 Tax=Symbiodinium natans TaxID=878477 RepID=A0A812MGK2_9DINO|nr:unnamed protein product [Symbiodinium natans]
MDGYLAILIAKKAASGFTLVIFDWASFATSRQGLLQAEIMVVLHLAASLALLAIEVPIFKIHLGLVSRNELAQEWKHNIHYIANGTSQGDSIPVEDLDDDEYNDLFDKGAFIYDPTRNPWDKGCSMNCWNFWCWPRWPAGEKGEF